MYIAWTCLRNETGISPLKSEGSTYTDPTQQATILNKQFESLFSKPKALSLKFLAELELWFQGLNLQNVKQMPDISISITGTENLLKNLNPNKASGPDESIPKLIKELHHEIAPILTKIFKSSLIPSSVTQAHCIPLPTFMMNEVSRNGSHLGNRGWLILVLHLMTGNLPSLPLYTNGPKCKPSNYRPISLTCIASKLMEHILVSNIMTHFDSNDILSPFQHGFRSKHSCGAQLISFTQEIFDSLEDGKQTDLIIMDFSKAFDKVDHNLLIYKRFNLDVNLKAVSWIKSFIIISFMLTVRSCLT